MNEMGKARPSLSTEEKRALLASLLRERVRRDRLTGPLSHGQRVLWLLQQREPDSTAYNTAFAIRLRSVVDRGALQRALQALTARHEALRTTFEAEEGRPVAVVHARLEPGFACVDARGWEAEELRRRVAEDYARPFDLERGPLLRATLFGLGEADHVLLLALHHIACDAWSIWILMHELGALYPAMAASREAGLPPVAAQYRDFVAWQDRLLAGPEGERAWQHWRQHLTGELPVLDLPTDRPRPAVQGMQGATHAFQIEGPLLQDLLAFGKATGATLFMCLLAAFQVLLHRLSGQEDIVVGSPAAGRSHPDMAATIGYFANPLPLRADLSGDPSFRAFLSQARHTVLDALAYQDMPFPLIVERLRPRRDPSRWPVVEAMLVLQRPPPSEAVLSLLAGEAAGGIEWGGLVVEPYPLAQMEGQLDLTLEIVEGQRSLSFALKYNPALFDADTIRRWAGHYRTVLATAVRDPDQRIGRLPLMTAEEREQILRLWQGVVRPWPLDRCLHHRIEEQARRTPERIALRMDGAAGEELTYRTLDLRANQLARHLQRLGAGPDQVVGVLADRSTDMVVALLGVLKAGAAYLPLDPDLPRQRLAFMLSDAEATAVVAQAHLAARLPPLSLPLVDLGADAAEIARHHPSSPEVAQSPDDIAYVIYTSGSTGQPKGVENTHRGICNRLLWMQDEYRLDAGDRVLQKTPFTFDVSVWEFFWPLMTGAMLVIARPDGHRDRDYLAGCIARHDITTLHFVPTMLQVFLGASGLAACRGPLRRVFCSGEALPPAVQQRFFERLDAELHNLYGPTEAAVDVTHWRCRPEAGLRSVPIGRPIANMRIHLLDRGMQPVPVGVPGELFIGGVGLARGYRNRPDLTAAAFVPAPPDLGPDERLYRTGDLCRRLPDGALDYIRRIDLQVKLRGIRIELGEIEAVLATHLQVEEAVVRVDGTGIGARLLAWFVPRPGAAPTDTELRRYLKDRVPDHMIPAAFLAMDSLPYGRNGKLDAAALPRPDPAGTAAASPPRTEVEQRIAAIWQAVLRLEAPDPERNFFDLGGHSLLLAEVQTRLAEAFGHAPAMVEMFQFTTIRALARFYAPAEADSGPAEPPWLVAQGRGAGDIAIIGMAGRFPGAPDVETLWRNLCDGVEGIATFDEAQLVAAGISAEMARDPRRVRAFGALNDIESFDAGFFGIAPREAELMDVQHRLLLECAWAALEDAGQDPATGNRRHGVFAGIGMNRYLLNNLLPNRELVERSDAYQLMLGNDKDFAPTRVAYKLGLTGPAVSVQTACSTSLVAVHMACRSLQQGECDTALAGGCSVTLPQDAGYLHQEGMILSPDGHCRAFDAMAQGTVGGNGVALVVLKRLEDALADGDAIQAVIRGSAINNDGAGKAGYTAPSVAGQAAVISSALATAAVAPDTIGYVEAHGTGTPLGDPIEIAALTRVFRTATDATGRCAIGSAKSNLGHLDSAAGVTGLIKAALAVRHGVVPPSLHFRTPNPALDLPGSPFFVPTEIGPWPLADGPRRAGVSSFGIGGTNAHVVLEEPPPQPEAPAGAVQLLLLSAREPDALDETAARLAGHLRRHPRLNLADAAFTLACGRQAFDHRRILVCRDAEGAAAALEGGAHPAERGTAGGTAPAVTFMFPGQGTQHLRMAAEVHAACPVFREQLDRCAALLEPRLGLDLRDLLYPAADRAQEAAEGLSQTRLAQPALFAVEYALAQLWMSWGVRPEAMIGHSLGEYVAACLAGVWTLEDALELIVLRAALMQAQPPGGMAAVPLSEAELRRLLPPDLALAAVNAPGFCVVSGPRPAIDAFAATLEARGVACHPLATSHAFHSPMMAPAAQSLLAHLRQVRCRPPRIPIVSNVTGDWITAEEAVSPDYWARHVLGTVRFADGLGTLLREPRRALIEVGPGHVLGGSARRHDGLAAEQPVLASLPAREGASDLAQLLDAAGRLWLAGGRLDWTAFYAGQGRRRVSLPGYAFRRQRYWIDPPRECDAGGGTPVRKAAIEDWFYLPTWQRLPPGGGAPVPGTHWLLLMDDGGVGAELSEQLRRRGVQVTPVQAGRRFLELDGGDCAIDPGSAGDYQALADALRRAGRLPDVVVHLWTLAPGGVAISPVAMRDRSFHSLVFLARSLFEQAPERRCHIAVVSRGLHDVLGGEAIDPAGALLLGPIAVIPQEFRGLTCSSIDIDPSPALRARQLEQLLRDAAAPGGPAPIAYRGAHRWAQAFVPAPLAAAMPGIPPGSVWMITGGTGGVGLTLAEWLARSAPGVRLALLSRSGTAQEDARRQDGTPDAAGGWPDLGEAVAGVGAAPDPQGANRHTRDAGRQEIERALDQLCLARIACLLEACGVELEPGRRHAPAEIRQRLAVVPKQEKFLAFLLRVLVEDGVLEEEADGTLVVRRGLPVGQAEAASRGLREAFPELAPVDDLLRHCAAQLGPVLRGETEAIGVLYPQGSLDLRGAEHALAHVLSERSRSIAALAELVGRLQARTPGRRLRILEVGGGGGELTLALMRRLDGAAVEYCFTDIGRSILAEAQRRAAELGLSAMRFATLDISRDPEAQGFDPGGYDLVVGLDVVHATRRVEVTLGHLGRLLAPGGMLGLLETVRPSRYLDLIWGFAEGWWQFEDHELRRRSPLLTIPQWTAALRRCGFAEAAALPGETEPVEHALILARAAGQATGAERSDDGPSERLRRLGAEVLTLRADVADRGQMRQALAAIEAQLGPLGGVIHAAGIAGGGTIQIRTREDSEREFAAKVDGTLALVEALGDRPLDAFVLCSSVTSATGGFGQVAYSAACAFQDAFAEMRAASRPGERTVSIDWDRWRTLGMAASLEARHRELTGEELEGGMSAAEGVEAFGRILAANSPRVVVSPRDFPALVAQSRSWQLGRIEAQAGRQALHPRPRLAADYAAPDGETEALIAGIWQEELGIERVGARDDFFALGGDSLIAIKLAARLRQALEVPISARMLYEAPTVTTLAEHVESLRWVAQGPDAAADAAQEEGLL